MKVFQINATCSSGSTGKICVNISQLLTAKNIENYILFSEGKNNYPLGIRIANPLYIKCQAFISKLLGNYGFNSLLATRSIIKKLNKIKPDIVHLHNIHAHSVNLKILFKYLKQANVKTVWTFHDCWAFTGYCTYFDMVKCEKWTSNCHNCPLHKKHSWFFDSSDSLFRKKHKLFTDFKINIVTPSKWLCDNVQKSFLKNQPITVINNGIDLSVFKPTVGNLKNSYNLNGKFVILGVAFDWGQRKGLDVFIELSKRLDEKYQIILVGTNEKIDKILPKNIISIHRTSNQAELAELYTTADVFINPTREENFPTVNIESLACGTPIITFCTGGSPEIIDHTCGYVTDKNDVDAIIDKIHFIDKQNPFSAQACYDRANKFDGQNAFAEYIELYEKLLSQGD